MENLIENVELIPLERHWDDRGYFEEVLRIDHIEKFGQWSHSMMYQGVIKAWHIHKIQWDYWHVPIGVLKAVLYDNRMSSKTYGMINEFILGERAGQYVLAIPPGVAHGCKVLQGPCHLFYVTSETYNPEDEGRLSHDSKSIGYDWLKSQEIK